MRRTIDFLLCDWLGIVALCERPRFSEHALDTFKAVLDTCEEISAEKFAPFNRLVDLQEPRLDGDTVVLPRCTYDAINAYIESGMLAAGQDYENDGMQLPYVVEMAANAFFGRDSAALSGTGMLTVANANLLMAHGSEMQKSVFARNEFSGRWFGTMCMSEPHSGSSLADITTQAIPDGENYAVDPLGERHRLFGNKMWISAGDHELSENIIHLVLAKIPDEDGTLVAGTRGISLFVVPKKMVNSEGQLTGERNDVAIAGLNHKLGNRGMPNALLNFGEGRFQVGGSPGAIGYLVGRPGEGLRYMFHMMNEARIGVGLAATVIGYAGYEASLEYARERRQGRRVGSAGNDYSRQQVRIIEHTDVRRMLLAQKAYVEGGLALELYCARLVDELRTGTTEEAGKAKCLLEVLTPIAKSWPSEWCLEANSLAIQIHGGYGYTRDFPVELYWRDNRLNMIHEGTHGIQGLDLLGRKVNLDDGAAFAQLGVKIAKTVHMAGTIPELSIFSLALDQGFERLRAATHAAWETEIPEDATANATAYLQAFGHLTIAWIWLELAITAVRLLDDEKSLASQEFLRGKLQATKYFYDYELPKVEAWLSVVASRNSTCREMLEEWFV
jgi:alkylation response protein AidB-like acyl-CoA dehydrogenase